MPEQLLTINVNGKEYKLEEPTVYDLETLASTLGHTYEDHHGEMVGSIQKLLGVATTVSFLLSNSDHEYEVAHILKDDPESFLELLEESDFGKVLFALESQGAHWFSSYDMLARELDCIQVGTFSAEDVLAEFHPDLYTALDDGGALSYFDADDYVTSCLDITVELRWYDGNDYWKIS